MQILHITPSYKPAFVYGGTTVSVSQLCETLAENPQHTVTVLTTTANGQTELPLADKKPVCVNGVWVYYFRRLTKDHSHFSPALLWFLFRHIQKFEVVHIHSWWNLVAVFAVFVCYLRGVKPILAPRGMLSQYSFVNENSPKKKIIHAFLGRFLLSKTILHATASAEFVEAQQLITSWRGFVLPNILPLSPFLSETDLIPTSLQKNHSINLLFLSRIDRKKGIEILFESLALLLPLQTFHVTIIGGGEKNYLQELQTIANNLQLTPHITWAGRIEGNLRFQYYRQADIFVLLSQNENFANVVIEALSQGTPVFISENVGLASYITEKQLGEVVGLEKEKIAKKLHNFIQNHIKREQIRQTAPITIAQDFNKTYIAQQYIQAYEKYQN